MFCHGGTGTKSVVRSDMCGKSQGDLQWEYDHLSFPPQSPKQYRLPFAHLPPTIYGLFMMNTSLWKWLLVLCMAGTFCHTKFNHFYLPSTALSKCWHGHFRTGLIISRSYDGHFLYLINPERQIFAEHHTAVGQQRTAFPELSMKIQSCLYDVYCFLSLFYCSHLFLVPGPLGELRAKEYLFWGGGIFKISWSYPSDDFLFWWLFSNLANQFSPEAKS